MVREIQASVLLVLGVTMLRISLGDMYLNYVKEGMRPLLVASGAVLVLLGAAAVVADSRKTASAAGSPSESHGHDAPRSSWLLLLPVLAIFLIAPPPLGSYAADRDTGAVAKPTNDSPFPALPAGRTVDLTVSDYASRAVWDRGRTLKGRTVRLTGFVTPAKGAGWHLTRIALACCAADGSAVKVSVRNAAAPPNDAWIRLTGSYRPSADRSADALPVISADSVRQIPQPRDPYE